jgi:hypothetical protein
MAFADGRTDFSKHVRRAIQSPLLLSIAGLWLLLLVVETARPCFFLHDDNATWFIGAYVHDFRILTETGRFAEVNFNQYGGEPFLEQGQTAVLYPPVYVGVALAKWISGDLRWTIEWITAEHLTLGLIGFYFWLRNGGVTPALAALGGLAWVLSPFVLIVGSSWVIVTFVAAWLPWLFWALDRLWQRPCTFTAAVLGIIAALFFLQGYVQWVVYSFLFLALYTLLRFISRAEPARTGHRAVIVYHLLISAIVFLILTLPLLLPMLHAVDASAARARPLSLIEALYYRVTWSDLLCAQFCLFRPLMFGISSAILYCPVLFLLPVIIVRFFATGTELRPRLFSLLVLSVLAIFFSSRWHLFLSLLPVLERFRWPFKVFLLADFFLLASLVWSVSTWTRERSSSTVRANLLGIVCVAFVLLANLTVSLSFHDGNFFSKTVLPTSQNPFPPGLDPNLGRVIAYDSQLPELTCSRFFTHGYSTFFDVPCLGGYDPLVGREQISYALGLDFPNFLKPPLTPDVRERLDSLAVRYWIVEPGSPQFHELTGSQGFRIRDVAPDRIVLEDMDAAPLVYSETAPMTACPMTYAGNSILIPIAGVTSPVEVSVGPTDGWWYRLDRGPWLRAVYRNDRLEVAFQRSSHLLEISYFDARFRQGLRWSAGLLIVLLLLSVARRLVANRTVTSS